MGAWQRLKALDVRFKDPSEELAFRRALEPELLRGAFAASLCACVGGIAYGSSAEPDLWEGEARVRRLQVLWLLIPSALAVLILIHAKCGALRKWNWEVLVLVALVCIAPAIVFGQAPRLAPLPGEEVDRCGAGNSWSLLGLHGLVSLTALQAPIRVALSWLVPVAAMFALAMALALPLGADASALLPGMLALAGFSALVWRGAWSLERYRRREWCAMRRGGGGAGAEARQQAHFASSLIKVSSVLCDALLHLDSDLRLRQSELTHESFFEEAAEGESFLCFLEPEDADRFRACARRATLSQMPECMPVTLQRRYNTSEAHLVLLDTGHESLRYMLGIRVEREQPRSRFPSEGAVRSRRLFLPEGNMSEESCEPLDSHGPRVGRETSMECEPSSKLPNMNEIGSSNFNERSISLQAEDRLRVARAAALVKQMLNDDASSGSDSPRSTGREIPGLLDASPEHAGILAVAVCPPPGASVSAIVVHPPDGFERSSFSSLLPSGQPMVAIDENAASDFGGSAVFSPGVFRHLVPRATGVRARAGCVRMLLPRWTIPRVSSSCCHFHTCVASVVQALEQLVEESCDPLFSSYPEQCQRCLCMNLGARCVVCGAGAEAG